MSEQVSLHALVRDLPPFSPEDSINTVVDRLLSDAYQHVLSVPVVEGGRPIGAISRHHLNQILLKKFGRDLYGARPVRDFMSPDPLIVDIDQSLEAAAAYVTAHMRKPLSEDFIVTDEGQYKGIGAVLDLLGAMEQHVRSTAKDLAQALRTVKSSQAQLVQSEKMAALGQMVAGVAHEINTPLGYVRNNVEMIRELSAQTSDLVGAYQRVVDGLLAMDENSEEQLAIELANLDDLRAAISPEAMFMDLETTFSDTLYGVDQIGELVLGLKDFSRIDQAVTDRVSINECIENSLLIARNALKYKVTVVKRLAELPLISCVPSQINQVLLNLFTNAAQAIEDKGQLLIRSWSDESAIYVSVQDTGKGISSENLKKIFDPFFTTKPVGQGTGLGLSISYQIIQRHGGRIQVASRPGVGTRFVITLPRQLAEPLAKAG